MSTAASLVAPPPQPPTPLAVSALPTSPVTASTPESAGARRDRVRLDELFKLDRPPGYYDESARVALLRRGRRRPHDQMLVEFAGSDVLTELTAAGRVLWCSLWNWHATIDGQPLSAAGPWRELCWHTDSEVDYLEIELPLAAGWKLQRQFVLSRKDKFVYLADALLGSREAPAAEIRYAATLALARGVRLAAAGETREAWLTAGRRRSATLVPLALPEWRAERCHSDLAAGADGTLVLMQAAQGRALYAPLWIDLDPQRARQPLTWRRLTVAENLQVLQRDAAVGYRVQIGRGHWLTYRTLAPRGNRTVLGQNYSADFVCCRLLKDGTTDGIIEIQ